MGVAGVGRFQLPLAAAAIVMGGHVRVGLEDNIYYSKGVLAKSNAELVARIVRLANELVAPSPPSEDARPRLAHALSDSLTLRKVRKVRPYALRCVSVRPNAFTLASRGRVGDPGNVVVDDGRDENRS